MARATESHSSPMGYCCFRQCWTTVLRGPGDCARKKLYQVKLFFSLFYFLEPRKAPIKFSVSLLSIPGIFRRSRNYWTINFRIPEHLVVIFRALSIIAVSLHGSLELKPRAQVISSARYLKLYLAHRNR